MAKAAKNDRQTKIKFLQQLVKSGKVTAPKHAHAALKKKFGSSLTFADASIVLGGGVPGDDPIPRKNKKGKKKPGRKKKGTPGRPRKQASSQPRYILLSTSEPGSRWEAETKPQVRSALQEMLDQGENPGNIALYERQAFDAERSYKITF